MKDFIKQEQLAGPEWEFYQHDQKASVYVLVFPNIGFYVGFTKKRYNEGFHGCISTYFGSGNTISHLKSQGVQPKRYILASGTAHEMKLLEDRILANTITRNGSLNITLGTLNAMEAIQDGVDLCDGAKVRLKNIVKHFQNTDEDKLFFDAKRTKLRENASLRSELLQLATLEACHAG
jgi:hypothetical protein